VERLRACPHCGAPVIIRRTFCGTELPVHPDSVWVAASKSGRSIQVVNVHGVVEHAVHEVGEDHPGARKAWKLHVHREVKP
jgi:hypothetical protein